MPSAIRVIDQADEIVADTTNFNGILGGGDSDVQTALETLDDFSADPGGSTKQVQYNNSSAFGGATGFEWQNATPNVTIQAQAAAHVALLVKAAGSQSANIQEWRDSDGNVVGGVDERGVPFFNANTSVGNVFIGNNTGNASQTGNDSVAIGSGALVDETTPGGNVGIGHNAGANIIGATGNIAIGYDALKFNSVGVNNMAIGSYSLDANTGSNNVGVGASTLGAQTSSHYNIGIGRAAGGWTTTGDNNIFIGGISGDDITTGSGNVYIGHDAGGLGNVSNTLFIHNADSATPLIHGDFANTRLLINGDFGIKVYSQDAEPTLGADNYMCIWKDTNDSNRIYLLFRRGNADHVKVELT